MKTKEIRGKKVILRERRSEDAAFLHIGTISHR